MFIISKNNANIISILKITTKIITIIVAMLIISLFCVMLTYKPAYKVTLNNEKVGYISDKEGFELSLNTFLNESNEKIAYVHIDEMPNYEFFFVRKNTQVNDNEIYELVKTNAIIYNRVYTINSGEDEIAMVETKEQAEKLLEEIKSNINNSAVAFTINESHIVDPVFSNEEDTVALAKEKYSIKRVAKSSVASNTSAKEYSYVTTNVSFRSPARGTITSRYGYRSSGYHTGVDIANPVGTPIYAAADGVVLHADVRGSYGRTVIIQHANNMITYYAHCNELLVKQGDNITVGQKIATIGMTGNTTGPHVHFEVRINNETVNPQNYVKNIGQ